MLANNQRLTQMEHQQAIGNRRVTILPLRRLSAAFLREVHDDDVAGACAEVAYYALFTVPPMIVLLTALAALIDRVTTFPMAERLRSLIIWNAPNDTLAPLLAFVDRAVEEIGSGTATFGIVATSLVAIWSGANAIRGLFKAFNRAYDVIETRSYHRMRLLALILAVLVPVAIVGAFSLWIFGGRPGTGWNSGSIWELVSGLSGTSYAGRRRSWSSWHCSLCCIMSGQMSVNHGAGSPPARSWRPYSGS